MGISERKNFLLRRARSTADAIYKAYMRLKSKTDPSVWDSSGKNEDISAINELVSKNYAIHSIYVRSKRPTVISTDIQKQMNLRNGEAFVMSTKLQDGFDKGSIRPVLYLIVKPKSK